MELKSGNLYRLLNFMYVQMNAIHHFISHMNTFCVHDMHHMEGKNNNLSIKEFCEKSIFNQKSISGKYFIKIKMQFGNGQVHW